MITWLHARCSAAAIETINQHGTQVAGSPILQGNSPPSLRLQEAVAEMLELRHVVLFPTGWAAGYGAITALIRAKDHVVLDQHAHNCCVQERWSRLIMCIGCDISRPTHSATARRIRATDTENAILVVTEGIFHERRLARSLSASNRLSRV
jgi:7-keto-8-aminopelargonate synthetase-like enzyme